MFIEQESRYVRSNPPVTIAILLVIALLVGGAAIAGNSARAQDTENAQPPVKTISAGPCGGPGVADVDADVPVIFQAKVKIDAPTGSFATGPMCAQVKPDKGFVQVTPCDNVVIMCETMTFRMDETVTQGEVVSLKGE